MERYLQKAGAFQDSSQWDSAIFYYEQAAEVYEQNNDKTEAIEARIRLNLCLLSATQFDEAETGLNQLLKQAQSLLPSQDLTYAHILDALGRLSNETGSYAEAKSRLQESLSIKQKYRLRDDDISKTYFNLGNSFREMGESEEAMRAYEADLAIRKELYGDKNIKTVSAYANMAILLRNTGKFEEALDLYLTCDSITLKHFGKDHKQRAANLNGIAIIYAQTGRYPEALKYFNELLAIDKKTLGANHPYLAKTYTNLGILHELMGDYKTAQDLHKKSLAIKLKSFEPDNPNLIVDYQGLSVIMNHIGDEDQALLYQRQVLQMEKAAYNANDPRIGTTYNMLASTLQRRGDFQSAWENLEEAEKIFLQNDKDFISLGPVYHTMASILEDQGQLREALPFAYKALSINLKAGAQHPHVAGNHSMIGTIFRNLGQIDSARYHYKIALDIDQKVFGEKHLEVAQSYGQLAELYFLADDFTKALEQIQLAINAAAESYDHLDIDLNPTPGQTLIPSTVAALLGEKGKILNYYAQQNGDDDLLHSAMLTFDAAIQMIDAAQFTYKTQGSVLRLREELDPVFEQAMDVAYQIFEKTQNPEYLEKAFHISEKNKAALLVSALNESRAKTFAGIPDSLIEKDNALKRDLIYFEQLLSEEKSKNGADSEYAKILQSDIFRYKGEHDQLIENFGKNYPQYYQLKYDKQTNSITEIRKLLNNQNELLVEYFLGEKYLYIFTMSNQEQAHFFRTNLPEDFQEIINSFKSELTNSQGMVTSFVDKSKRLYSILIKPFEEILTDQKITIIPDAELGYIPFEILVSDKSEAHSFNLPYLFKKHPISYAYSATYLDEQAAEQSRTSGLRYLAFAPNFNSRTDDGNALIPDLLASRGTVRGGLAELKGANEEVKSLSQYFDGIYLQNEEATERRFKDLAHDFAIIHLATHAIIDEVNPLNSRLLFTIDGDSIEDGDLNAWELFNLQLNAKLAVLSACNTGFGKIQKGEGILSLGRAFAFAGCPSRLMSLWPAQDASTANIMIQFYKYLANGLSKDEALRKAKMDYLEHAADFNLHPFYWAGFVLQGDPSPIVEKSFFTPLLLGFLGLGFLGFLFWKFNPGATKKNRA